MVVRCLILLGKNEDALNVLQSLPAFRVDTPLKFILSIEAHQRKHTRNEDHKTIGYLERSAIAAFPDDPLILAKKLELNTDLFLCNMAEGKQNQDLANTILSECKIILETKSSREKTASAFYLSFVLNYVVWAVENLSKQNPQSILLKLKTHSGFIPLLYRIGCLPGAFLKQRIK